MRQRSYNFDDIIESIKAVDDTGSLRNTLLAMDEKEFKKLYYGMNYTMSFMRDFQKATKAVATERRNDYGKMARHAKKRFSEIDIAILELLHNDYEHIYHKAGIFNHLKDEAGIWGEDFYPLAGSGPAWKAMEKSLKLMRRRGLIEVALGWSEDEGTPGGSGYTEMHHKREVVSQILYNYNIKNAELPL